MTSDAVFERLPNVASCSKLAFKSYWLSLRAQRSNLQYFLIDCFVAALLAMTTTTIWKLIYYSGPTPFIAEDARRIVSATMDLNRYDVADGKLILGLILFVAQQWGWHVQWCAGPSLQDDYFAMFTQRIRPVIVGPTRVDIHGRMVHPMIALYHDLLHLSQIARRYPLDDKTPFQEQIALYHRVKGALDAAGLDDSEWFGYGPRIGFTLLSLLCEGAALDDARFDLCEDFDTVIRALRAQEKVAAAS